MKDNPGFCRFSIRLWAGIISCLVIFTWMSNKVSAKSVRWDNDSDWAKGAPSNVTWNKTPGQLEIVFDPNAVVETPFIYIPSSSLNTITKMDTRNGQILWTFNLNALGLGNSPSRTTVDSDGNVWVGLRGGSHVVAISAQGKHIASVNVGSGPRAVTIDKQGNIWAGGYNAASIVKISRTNFQPILTVRDSRICTYGATTDANGNIWTMNRCQGHTAQIAPDGRIIKFVSTPGGYGIMADRLGYVWVASWDNSVAYRIHASNYGIQTYQLGARGRGVGVDANNRAWIACSHNNSSQETRHLVRIDPATSQVDIFRNVGPHTIGVAIDSKGFVWANSYSEGKAYKLRVSDGTFIAAYDICDTTGTRPCANTGCTKCPSPASSGPYTYSDMTGFSIQTKPAKGTWIVRYDASCKANFSKISWNGSIPNGTSVKVRARSATSEADLTNASWGNYVGTGQSPAIAANRWIEVEFSMETNDARYTPVVTDATLDFDYFTEVCDGVDNDCNGQIDEQWPDLGQPCAVGVGACERKGIRVCNAAQNATTCSAQPGQPQQEICDGLDNDCNGKIDENFTDLGAPCKVGLGICEASGVRICHANKTQTTCSAQPGQPQQEVCDGLDNNCDGAIDEKWPNKGTPCTVGVGSCQNQGTWICQNDKSGVVCSVPPKAPQPEICDGADNDCNGKIDDGLIRACQTQCGSGTQICQAGQWTTCSARVPQTEICNDIDDDCNGQVDDNLVRVCSTACGKGKETCVRGKWAFCDAPAPEPETCDGKDNDCNGQIDDGLPPRRCLGDCGEGTATCQNGKWGGCSGPSPEPETCDGKDNDCNGLIDDNLEKRCRTACGDGRQVCRGGQWTLCNAPQPGREICDSKDNDCDGRIDNGENLCPNNMACDNGSCQQKCRNAECPKGMRCVNNVCASETDPCANIKCADGTRCVGGTCIDPCYLISCPLDQICEKGACVEDNCYRKGCPNGQRCVDGKCEKDPCDGVSCAAQQFCRDGKCVGSCANVSCAADETCIDGTCTKKPVDPCSQVKCPAGQRCEKGACQADPCDAVSCPKGRLCVEGLCRHDPCFNIFCPNGQVCIESQCVGDPQAGENPSSNENVNPSEQETSDGGTVSDDGTQTKPDDSSTTASDDTIGSGDKQSGTPNTTPDVAGPRYQPGNCGCHHEGGPISLLFWLALTLLFLYLRGFGFRRTR